MTNLRQAAQQALEALGKYDRVSALEFLRTALAEPDWKPLTDEEIDALPLPPSGTATVRDIVRLIERAHGIGEKT